MLRTLFDNIPDAIFYKDENSKYLGCNIMCSKEFMQKEEVDLVGKDDVEIYGDEEQYRKFIEKDKEIMKSRQSVRTEAKFIVADGGIRHMESIKAPI